MKFKPSLILLGDPGLDDRIILVRPDEHLGGDLAIKLAPRGLVDFSRMISSEHCKEALVCKTSQLAALSEQCRRGSAEHHLEPHLCRREEGSTQVTSGTPRE